MTLKLTLDDEVAECLEKQADSDSVSVEQLANQVLANFTQEINPAESGEPSEPWSVEKNERRCQLIDLQIEGKITEAERTELDQLQIEMRFFLNQESGFDLDTARAVHQKLQQAES